jgi:hypothetical protein
VALQALQQDPATFVNQSIQLAGCRTTIDQSNPAGCHTKIHQSIWQAATQNQFTCQAATEQSINPTERAGTQQSISKSGRPQHKMAVTELSFNPTERAGTQQSINQSGRPQHKINSPVRPPQNNQSIHLAGHHTTIHQSIR